MEKGTKLTYLLLVTAILSSVLHNLVSACLGIEEPVFFFLTLIAAAAFLVSIPVNLYTYKTKGRPKDLWRLGTGAGLAVPHRHTNLEQEKTALKSYVALSKNSFNHTCARYRHCHLSPLP